MPRKTKRDHEKMSRDGIFNVDLEMFWYRADEVAKRAKADGIQQVELPKFAKFKKKRQ